MDLPTVKAEDRGGTLPEANGVTARHVRHGSGVCVECDVAFGANDVGVQILASGQRRLACADVVAVLTRGKVCGINSGPRASVSPGGGLANIHVGCRDTIKCDGRVPSAAPTESRRNQPLEPWRPSAGSMTSGDEIRRGCDAHVPGPAPRSSSMSAAGAAPPSKKSAALERQRNNDVVFLVTLFDLVEIVQHGDDEVG
jgi:hypothetical protein